MSICKAFLVENMGLYIITQEYVDIELRCIYRIFFLDLVHSNTSLWLDQEQVDWKLKYENSKDSKMFKMEFIFEYLSEDVAGLHLIDFHVRGKTKHEHKNVQIFLHHQDHLYYWKEGNKMVKFVSGISSYKI